MDWKERKRLLEERTQQSAINRDTKSNNCLTYASIPDREILWADKLRKGRDGNNVFDFLPFIITAEWYKDMRTFFGKRTGLIPGSVDYKLEYARHRGIGPEKADVLCLAETFGKPCALCDERTRLTESPEEDPGSKKADALKPKWRTLYNIIDLQSDQEIRLWEHSYHLFEKLLLNEIIIGGEEKGFRGFWDIEEGFTVEWRGQEESIGGGKSFIEAGRIDFVNREPYGENILEEVYPLDLMLNIPTYDEQVKILTGMTDDVENNPPEDQSTRRRGEGRNTNDTNQRRRYSGTQNEETASEPNGQGDGQANKEQGQDIVCPEGLKFAEDFDRHPECNNCDNEVYNSCQEEKVAIDKQKPKDEPEQTSSRRRRNTGSETSEKETGKEPGRRSGRRRRG